MQAPQRAAHDVLVDLQHFAVVGEQAVDLVLDVAELGINGRGQPVRHRRRELVVVQADDCFVSETGELVRISAADPQQDQQSLQLNGDNPVFQPLTIE